ncbi:MAG: hypothetical protein HY981_03050 [Candidatus Magasanikbacteria bacterium]|nr:hypothetical protein [Candidatus Magasanikbacteria bacterium]
MLINEPEQINDLTLEELESDDVFNQIRVLADSCKENARFDSDAVQMRRALEAKLKLPETNEYLKARYAPLVLVFKFSGLLVGSDYDRVEIVKNQTVEALKNGIDVKSCLNDYFIASNDLLLDYAGRRKIIQALRENQELLGGTPLKDWLARFAASGQAGKRSGTLERLNFINNNSETKSLKKDEKELLRKLFELLDFLEYTDEEEMKSDWDVLVRGKNGEEVRMKMADFRAMKSGVRTQEVAVFEPAEAPKVKPVKEASAPVAHVNEKPEEISPLDYIIKNNLAPAQCVAYLKKQFPEPADFKKVLKILNELNRQGYAQYMDIIYFDQTDEKFHWNE